MRLPARCQYRMLKNAAATAAAASSSSFSVEANTDCDDAGDCVVAKVIVTVEEEQYIIGKDGSWKNYIPSKYNTVSW